MPAQPERRDTTVYLHIITPGFFRQVRVEHPDEPTRRDLIRIAALERLAERHHAPIKMTTYRLS